MTASRKRVSLKRAVEISRSRIMRAVRRADTTPEILVRKTAHSLGLRFRLHRRELPGTPDLVFVGQRTVVFVHGCFWHRHPGCGRASMPKTRTKFWSRKFKANVARDRRVTQELRALEWRVIVIWECEARFAYIVTRRLRRLARSSKAA